MTEKLEYVHDELKIYQEPGVFFYGTDAVLLAAYAFRSAEGIKNGFELCSGTGFVSLEMLSRHRNLVMTACDINEQAVALSKKSAGVSALSDRFSVSVQDLCRLRGVYPAESYDFIVCNPPYMTANCGYLCADDYKTIARHEILCTIGDVFEAAFYLLRTSCPLYLVYRPDRLSSLFEAARSHRFEIKRMTFVHSLPEKGPVLVLCEAKKQASEGLLVSAPFFLRDGNGNESDAMRLVREKGEMPRGQ